MLLLLNTLLAGPPGVQAYVHAFKEYVNNEQHLEVTELPCAAASLTPAAAAAGDGGDEVAPGTGFKVLDAVVRNDFMYFMEIIPVTLSPDIHVPVVAASSRATAMDVNGAQVSHLAANCTITGNHGTCLLLLLLQQGICHIYVGIDSTATYPGSSGGS